MWGKLSNHLFVSSPKPKFKFIFSTCGIICSFKKKTEWFVFLKKNLSRKTWRTCEIYQDAVAKSHLLWEPESVLCQLSLSRERHGRVGAARQHGEGSVRTSLMQSRCLSMVPRVLQRQQSLPWQHWNLPSTSAKPEDASNMWWAHTLLLHPIPPGKSLPLMLLNPWLHLCSEGEWSARISWREAVQGKANRLRVSLPFREGLVVGTALAVASGAACSHHGGSGSREPTGSGTWNETSSPCPTFWRLRTL